MPTAILADDERLMRDQLRMRLGQVWPELEIVGEAKNGDEAIELAFNRVRDQARDGGVQRGRRQGGGPRRVHRAGHLDHRVIGQDVQRWLVIVTEQAMRMACLAVARQAGIENGDLAAGTVLYLPVETEGALFSVGDTHAAQGDGEVCGTAIESQMNVTATLDLIKGANLDYICSGGGSEERDKDTVWFGLLHHIDVAPDGTAWNLASPGTALIRASYRVRRGAQSDGSAPSPARSL